MCTMIIEWSPCNQVKFYYWVIINKGGNKYPYRKFCLFNLVCNDEFQLPRRFNWFKSCSFYLLKFSLFPKHVGPGVLIYFKKREGGGGLKPLTKWSYGAKLTLTAAKGQWNAFEFPDSPVNRHLFCKDPGWSPHYFCFFSPPKIDSRGEINKNASDRNWLLDMLLSAWQVTA